MKQQFCFPLKNKGFLFVKNSLIVLHTWSCVEGEHSQGMGHICFLSNKLHGSDKEGK